MNVVVEPRLGEQVHCHQIGGMPVYLVPKPGFHGTHALLSVGYGSIDRCFCPAGGGQELVPDGVAHFLEHRLFASSLGDVGDQFAALGAEVNAHTTFTNTSFFFSATEEVDACLELLLRFVLAPELAAEGVEREREIILRELQLYGDNHEWINFVDVLRALYGTHPLGVDIAGTAESIGAIDSALLRYCHGAFYQPANMVLIVGGEIQPETLAATLARCLPGNTAVPLPRRCRQPALGPPGGARVSRLPVALPRVTLGFADRGPRSQGMELLREELCAELLLDLLFGSSSEFYARHYESGLIDGDSFGVDLYLEPEFAFCLVGGDTPDPGLLAAEIQRELESARRGDQLEKGFPRAARRAYGQAVQRLDQVEGAVGAVFSGVARGAGPFGFFEVHGQIGPEDLRHYLEHRLLPAHRAEAWVLPGRLEAPNGG